MVVNTTASKQEVANLLSRLDRIPVTRSNVLFAIILTFVWLCEGFDVGIVGPVIMMVKKMWGLTPHDTGLLGICSTVGIIIGAIFAGRLMDKFGRKRVMLVGVTIFSIFTAACGAIPNIDWVIAMRFIAGLGLGAVFPIPYLMMSELIGARWRATVIGVTSGVLILWYSVPNLVGMWAIASFPIEFAWRVPFLIGAIPLVLVIIMYKWLPESPRWLLQQGRPDEVRRLVRMLEDEAKMEHDEGFINPSIQRSLEAVADRRGGYAQLFRKPYSSRVVIAFLTGAGCITCSYTLIVYAPMLFSSRGLSFGNALQLSASLAFFGLIGAIIIGWLSDIKGRKFTFTLYSLLAAAGFGLMAQSTSATTLIAGAFFAACCGLGFAPFVKTYNTEQFPTYLRGTGSGIMEALARGFGGVVMAYSIPHIFAAGGVKAVFWAVAGIFLACVVPFAIWGRESARMSVEEASAEEGVLTPADKGRAVYAGQKI